MKKTALFSAALPWTVLLMLLPCMQVLAASPKCQDPASTMLWQVQGGSNSAATVQLFGSIHVGKADFYPLPPVVSQRFEAAETVVFEVDPATMATPAAVTAIQQRGLLPATTSLEQEVSAATMAKLSQALQQLALPALLVQRMRPWMVAMTLTAMQVQKLGYEPHNGVESYLMRQKPLTTVVAELESFEAQLALMESLDQEVFLRYSLADFSNTAVQIEQMVNAWRCGDHAALADILFSARNEITTASAADQTALEQLMNRLFDQRNVAMVAKIVTYLQRGAGDYFVVVGAGHLLGTGSVVELLEQQGYKVTPVKQQ